MAKVNRYDARRDANEGPIVSALVDAGFAVQKLSGKDIPDLLVGKNGVNILIEVKNPETYGKATEGQSDWHDNWPGQSAIVETPEEAVRVANETLRLPAPIREALNDSIGALAKLESIIKAVRYGRLEDL